MTSIDDPDIARAARHMIEKYGDSAVVVAAKRASDLVADGQRQACALWIRIGAAVQQLQRERKG